MKTGRRTAGAGSLGRPRWIGIADWRGAPVVREAKALLPSSWTCVHGRANARSRCSEIVNGRYRPIDPWYRIDDAIAVRRLSPNNRKIEAEEAGALLAPPMLETMGLELANVHLGVADRGTAIARDLARRKRGWLTAFARKMAASVEAEFAEWSSAQAASG